MYETVKTVKGHDITRAVGHKFPFYVEDKKGVSYYTFKTLKAAVNFIETAL